MKVMAVCISERKGEIKHQVDGATLIADHGIEGDAHAGSERQVSLLCEASVAKMEGLGVDLVPGIFAENILVSGMTIEGVEVGKRLGLPSGALLEVTRIGKPCHQGCAIREKVGDCVMPREGFFVRVIRGGALAPGDALSWQD